MTYQREFCAICKRYSVHEDGVCMAHEAECFECHKPIVTDQGRYKLSEKLTYCEPCGDKRVAPRFVL